MHRHEVESATEEEQEEEEDEVERGWMAETVSRANGIVSQCAAWRTVYPRVSVKIHRSVGREGELRRAALPGEARGTGARRY